MVVSSASPLSVVESSVLMGGGQVISPLCTMVIARITSFSIFSEISPFPSGQSSASKCRKLFAYISLDWAAIRLGKSVYPMI